MSSGSEAALKRRLQPLYEAIDARNFKSAMKLANAALQKHPESLLLKSLKALIFERTGKLDEAYELCSEVKRAESTDEHVLSTMCLVYKSVGKLEEATEAYAIAAAKSPENMDLMTMLFNSYVRQYSFVKQQQIAMKLYKKLEDPKFLFWAVCSIQLQVYRGGEGSARLLSLAEALLKKRIDSSSLQHLESLLLYLSILEQAGKIETAIEVLDGKLGELFSISLDKLRVQGGLEMRLGKFERAASIEMEILRSSPDDWASMLLYLDALLEVRGEAATWRRTDVPAKAPEANGKDEQVDLSFEEVERRLADARTFVRELQDLESDELRRGPFLAEVEIAFRLAERASRDEKSEAASSSSKQLADALLAYFKRYGHMVSFASDVRHYVFAVKGEEKLTLARMLQGECSEKANEERPAKELVKSLRRKIAAYQVEEQLGLLATLNDEEVVARAQVLAELYVKTLPLSADIDPKERGHGEELVVMAANAYCEMYRRKRKLGFVLGAILVLESGLALRRFNPQYKLMLMSLYLLLGAVTKAWAWYQTLEVKHIQLETLSHHMLPSLLRLDCWEEAEALLAKLGRFHDDHNRDAGDLVMAAYKNGIYSKVLEFVEFKDRLENSHQRLSGNVEGILLTLKELADNLGGATVVLNACGQGLVPLEWSTSDRLAALTFNEDLPTRPWWSKDPDTCLLAGPLNEDSEGAASAGHPETEGQRVAREDRWRNAVRRRCLLPRMCALVLSARASGASGEGEAGSAAGELRSLVAAYADRCGLRGSISALLASAESAPSATWPDTGRSSLHLLTVATFAAAADFLAVAERANDATPSEAKPTAGDDGEVDLPASLRQLGQLIGVIASRAKASVFLSDPSSLSPSTSTKGGHSQVSTHSGSGIMAPGPGVEELSAFVHETGAWLTLCLQTWARLLQPSTEKKKKKKEKEKALESPLGEQTKDIAVAVQNLAASYVQAMTGVASWLEETIKATTTSDDTEALWQEITVAEGHLEGESAAGPSNSQIKTVVELMAGAAWGHKATGAKEETEEGRERSMEEAKTGVVAEIVSGQRLLLKSIRQVAVGRADGVSKLKIALGTKA